MKGPIFFDKSHIYLHQLEVKIPVDETFSLVLQVQKNEAILYKIFKKVFDSICIYFCEEFLLLCSTRKLICALFWVMSQSLTSGRHTLQRTTSVAFLPSVICGRPKKCWLGFVNSFIVFSRDYVQAWTFLWRPLITASIPLLFMDLFELFLFS